MWAAEHLEGTHRFYPRGGKSGERRAGVSPEMSLGRCPEQPHDPAEIPLPGAARKPKLPRKTSRLGPSMERLQQAEALPILHKLSIPLPTELPACPRLLTDTHIRATHSRTPTRISAGVHTLISLDSPSLSTQLHPAMLREAHESSTPSYRFQDPPPLALACLGSF